MFENPAKRSRTRQMIVEQRARRKAQREKKAAGGIGKMQAKVKGVWKLDETQARCVLCPYMHLFSLESCQMVVIPTPPSALDGLHVRIAWFEAATGTRS